MQQTGASLWVLVVLVLQVCSASNSANAYVESLLNPSYGYSSGSNAEQSMEATVHGISATSEELNEYAQAVLHIADILNVKSIDDLNRDNTSAFRTLVSDIEHNENALCINVTCSEYNNKYRTINGVCNNLDKPLYGSSKTAQVRLVEPEWEKTALIDFKLNDPSVELAVDPYGVNPTEVPILFHVRGNAIFELLLLKSDTEAAVVECEEGADCQVEGIITAVEETNEFEYCTEGINLMFSGNELIVKGTCKGSFRITYLPYAARVVLDPNGEETKILNPNNEVLAENTEGNLFPGLDSDPQLFWIDYRRKRLRVGKGSECDERTILMQTRLPDKILTSSQSVAIAVSTASEGNVEVVFPIRETMRLKTSAHDVYNNMEKSLDAAPWLFTKGSLRFGVQANLKESPVTINLHDDEQNKLVKVVLGLKNRGSIEAFDDSTGTSTPIDSVDLKNVDVDTEFELYDGSIKTFARKPKKKKAGSAFWITWINNAIITGTGNIIGMGIINDSLSLTFEKKFTLNRVTLESVRNAVWYFDIVQRNIPRARSLTGRPLPTARDVSLGLHSKAGKDTIWSKSLTNAVFQFGQFLDHDIILTPTLRPDDVKPCCANKTLEDNLHEFCFPIIITDKTDASGSQGEFRSSEFECLPFIRSTAMIDCDPTDRDLRNRNMINLITSFVDASQVYAAEEELARELRDNRTGALMATEDGDELPTTTEVNEEASCQSPQINEKPCRLSGDPRNNEQPLLNGMHTLWVREHNRVVRALIEQGYKNETEEENEILYQEARRIVIAIMQVITYKQYLPAFMDSEILEKFQVTSPCSYDPNTNPSVPNEFGIAYRFGHTWIPILLGNLLLEDNFFNPVQSHTALGSDGLLDTMHSTSCPATDIFLETNVRDHLFREGRLATDLSALNVQRGRDHGVGTYCALREYFNLTVPETFDDMVRQNIVTEEMANNLKNCYDCVCDMDLFSAVLAETPLNEVDPSTSTSFIGTLLNHILADFFQKVKCGDRYWYEFNDAGFSADQVTEINKASLSRLLCDNVDPKIQRIQPNAFILPNDNNEEVDCSEIPELDLSKFGPSSYKRGVNIEKLKELDDLLSILRELEKKP